MKIEIVTFNFHGRNFWKRRRFFNLLSSIAATYFVAFVRGALLGTFCWDIFVTYVQSASSFQKSLRSESSLRQTIRDSPLISCFNPRALP